MALTPEHAYPAAAMSIKLTREKGPRVADAMSGVVVVVDHDATAAEARNTLADTRVSGAPVVKGESIVGVISQTDLLRADDATPVTELMSEDVYAVRPNDAALVAARVMAEREIHRVIVVDDAGTLFGVVTALDALRALLPTIPGDELATTSIEPDPS